MQNDVNIIEVQRVFDSFKGTGILKSVVVDERPSLQTTTAIPTVLQNPL
jgi:hypothetical protein